MTSLAPATDEALDSSVARRSLHTETTIARRIKSWHLLLLSACLHLALLFYADYVDSHPESYGGLKYTDVDWRVVMDGAKLIFAPGPGPGHLAEGWAGRWIAGHGFRIGK
jgi:phosphatidylinositol glycan class M